MNRTLEILRDRWRAPNGFYDVLRISAPLIISMVSHTVMLFTDRLFLGHYSLDALAASTPAGILAHTLCCFFIGIATFTNTFVAQYIGAGHPGRVGGVIWQGVYFSAAAGVLLAAGAPLGGPIFSATGHEPAVAAMETVYFKILMWGGGVIVAKSALECFYSGRGLTRLIMAINLAGMALNVPLDYALIFGKWGCPALGIAGSAIATVASHLVMLLLFAMAVFSRANERLFGTRGRRRFDGRVFARLLRFGFPVGVQFVVDMATFSFFILMVGRLGRDALAATNMAFALNTLAFMPMLGFSVAASTLVGQALGAGRPDDGERATGSALILTCCYMWTVALVFVLAPGVLCDIFRSQSHAPDEFLRIRTMAIVLMRFVAVYSVFDAVNVVYSGALKGAGDTRFIGWTIVCLSLFVVVIPVWAALRFFNAGIYTVWTFGSLYTCLLATVFWRRFRGGKWKTYKVIEPVRPVLEPVGPALHPVTD